MYFYVVIGVFMLLILFVISFRLIKRSKLKTKQLLAVMAFQEENKLSNRDLKVFKEVMSEAKKQILLAEQSTKWMANNQINVLSAINASKEIFKHLTDKPRDLVLYGDFLYRSLPAFTSALERRQKIELAAVEGEGVIQVKNELDNILTELTEVILTTFNEHMDEELKDTEIEQVVAR
ncbi:5-bromo-4-chloroindolyl phosphate hydrolysis family protein [Enterococcus faecalis]